MPKLEALCKLNGITLGDEVYERLEVFKGLLIKWGKRINLTSIMSPDEIEVKHFLDSLLGLRVIGNFKHNRIVDVGSGAGFPGIPLALVMKDSQFDLVESRLKRCIFLEEVKRKLGLANVKVICKDVRDVAGNYDVVIVRAFRGFNDTLKLTSHLLGSDNVLVVYRAGKPLNTNEAGFRLSNVDLDIKGLKVRRGFTLVSKVDSRRF